MIVASVSAALLALSAAPESASVEPIQASAGASRPDAALSFTSYAAEFAAFVDETAAMADAERVALFRHRFDGLFPGFYEPRGRDEQKYDAQILRALKGFGEIRSKYTIASNAFDQAFRTGSTRFRTFFPDYQLNMPVYLVHSLGEMDGGTRRLNGRTAMVFGADVIARIHDEATIGPFLDHELFHGYHANYFLDCDALWCSLWTEGLATYVASRLNQAASDKQLLLNEPVPLRAAVEPRIAEAMCLLRGKFGSTSREDQAAFFAGQPTDGPFPPRFGYFLGYQLTAKIGATMTLEQMAKLPPAKVKPLLEKAIAEYGPCPKPAAG